MGPREERSEGPGEPVWSGPGEAGKEFVFFSEMGMSVKSCTEQCRDRLDRFRPIAEKALERSLSRSRREVRRQDGNETEA